MRVIILSILLSVCICRADPPAEKYFVTLPSPLTTARGEVLGGGIIYDGKGGAAFIVRYYDATGGVIMRTLFWINSKRQLAKLDFPPPSPQDISVMRASPKSLILALDEGLAKAVRDKSGAITIEHFEPPSERMRQLDGFDPFGFFTTTHAGVPGVPIRLNRYSN